MVRRILSSLALSLALAGAGLAALGSAAEAQGCLSAGQARAAAQQGQIVPMSSLIGSIRAAAGGEILPPPQLCNVGGRYVYIVNVLKPNGQVSRLTVDAASGSIVGR
jgi:uncharacterized membrane protein YkoI